MCASPPPYVTFRHRLLTLITTCVLLAGPLGGAPAGAEPRVPAPRPATVAPAPRAPVATPARAKPLPATVRVRAPAGRRAEAATKAPVVVARDWAESPAIVEHVPKTDVFAVSDLHGHYEEGFALLLGNGLLRGDAKTPTSVEWTGGTSTLVVVGDLINKGPGSIALVDMFRTLQARAEKAGGKVIVTMGNHEADFLHAPTSARAMRDGTDGKLGFGHDLLRAGHDPTEVAGGLDAEGRGAWLRALPFAAKVGDSFFVHSGDTKGMTIPELASHVERTVRSGGFGHEGVNGDDRSLLGADDWKLTAAEAKTNAEKLGVKRIVMGHISSAFEADGAIARTHDGALVKLDTGLANDAGEPRIARWDREGKMRQLDTDAKARKIKGRW
jgi:hypothetical protein